MKSSRQSYTSSTAGFLHTKSLSLCFTGSYECRCKSGYLLSPDTKNCDDIDECLNENTNACAEDREICINRVGSYECRCRNNYTIFGKTYCVAQNPCNSSKHLPKAIPIFIGCHIPLTFSDPCHSNAICLINGPSYLCKCAPGYIEIGKSHFMNLDSR